MKRLIQLISITSLIVFSALHAEVDSAESSPESSTSVESTKSQESKSGAFGFCKGKVANTGCFIGAEVGLAFGSNHFQYLPELISSVSDPLLNDNKLLAVPVNVEFGHQWYYALNQGVRFKANIGYTNYKPNFPKYQANGGEADMRLTSHTLQYGLEVAWLYDFIANEAYNFGLNIGTGFEITHLIATQGSNQGLNAVGDFGTSAAWASSIGIHYFYKTHHQFFITYHYRTYSTIKGGAKVSIKDSLSSQNSIDVIPLGTFIASPRHMVSLSYAYKF